MSAAASIVHLIYNRPVHRARLVASPLTNRGLNDSRVAYKPTGCVINTMRRLSRRRAEWPATCSGHRPRTWRWNLSRAQSAAREHNWSQVGCGNSIQWQNMAGK
jgi:hypothetical protein